MLNIHVPAMEISLFFTMRSFYLSLYDVICSLILSWVACTYVDLSSESTVALVQMDENVEQTLMVTFERLLISVLVQNRWTSLLTTLVHWMINGESIPWEKSLWIATNYYFSSLQGVIFALSSPIRIIQVKRSRILSSGWKQTSSQR